jgi:hypothetical protein
MTDGFRGGAEAEREGKDAEDATPNRIFKAQAR